MTAVDANRDISHLDPALRDTVRVLGQMLGRVIATERGVNLVDRIEAIRALAKAARSTDAHDWEQLYEYLAEIPSFEVCDVVRAFNQFLNLANIAEQNQRVADLVETPPDPWADLFDVFESGRVAGAIENLEVEIVLTAHPTEVLRRTLILKYDAIAEELRHRDQVQGAARVECERNIERLIAEAWHTDEVRRERPSAQDEAKWGFAVIENSLWFALPRSLRALDRALSSRNLAPLPIHAVPLRVASWMGGDRDDNANVTAETTREVLMLARWMAADLYLRDIESLQASLSMSECNGELRKLVGPQQEPYRTLLKDVRDKLVATRDWAEALNPTAQPGIYHTDAELMEPLLVCYRSLNSSGMDSIAEGPLKDTLRRAAAFGVTLVRLDIRQRAERHTALLDEITRYLGLRRNNRGYADWDEAAKLEFLLAELDSKRPLFPQAWPASDEGREVFETCRAIAEQQGAGIAQYIVSGTAGPSDVLAVVLLLREAGLERPLPVVPLFETIENVDRAPGTIDSLLAIPWYKRHIDGRQQIMVGYSDLAKDAGQFAAAWAQYRTQEQLVEVAARHDVELTLFHGRGGAVGRGGGHGHTAILSQPAGTVSGRLRVTEQGETIRAKLGAPALAEETLSGYLAATLHATLEPPATPEPAWRDAMSEMSEQSRDSYREVVEIPDFVEFFRSLTPEEELDSLSLGSRPARRRATEDIARLQAIPWIFAWNQVRLMLPSWLGTDAALAKLEPDLFDAMSTWPFFQIQMDMLEMVLAKADVELVAFYSNRLLRGEFAELSERLPARLSALIERLVSLRHGSGLLDSELEVRDALTVRNTYLDPLHLLQAELLARLRRGAQDDVAQALRLTMAGIASGLRNTG